MVLHPAQNKVGKLTDNNEARGIVDLQAYRWVILLTTTGSQVTIALISQGVAALAPFLASGFSLTKAQLGVAGGAVNVGMGLAAFLAGRAVDVWGERIVLVAGGALVGFSAIAVSRAGSFAALISLLLLTGLWAATSTPAGSKAIMGWFPFHKRGFALGVRQTGVPMGGFWAALMLPAVAIRYNWRVALAGAGAIAVAGAFICLFLYRDYALKGRPMKANSRTTIDSRGKVFTNASIWFVSFCAITYIGAQFILVTYLVLFFHERLALSIGAASLFLALAQLAGVAGRIFWGTVSDTVFRGARKPALGSVGGLIAVMSLVMFFLTPTTPLWVFALVSWFFGFSAIGWNGVYVALVSELVGKEMAGTALGFSLSVVQMGVLIIPPLFGLMADQTGSYQVGWIFLALLVAGGVMSLGLVRETRVEERYGAAFKNGK